MFFDDPAQMYHYKQRYIQNKIENEVKKIAKQLVYSDSDGNLVKLIENGKPTKDMLDLTDIKQIEILLKDYQITIFKENSISENLIYYKGPANIKHVYICYSNSHFNTVTKPHVFLNCKYFCHSCKKGYDNLNQHACQINCKKCHREVCLDLEKNFQCLECKTKCNNSTCLKYHTQLCSKRETCKICYKKIFRNHVCENKKWCSTCQQSVEFNGHQCFIKNEKTKVYVYMFEHVYMHVNMYI